MITMFIFAFFIVFLLCLFFFFSSSKKNIKKIKKVLAILKYILYNKFRLEETIKNISFALLAQLEEHLTLNQGVQGSSPWRRM